MSSCASFNKANFFVSVDKYIYFLKITLPTGTEINVHISSLSFGSVTIKPSIYDINEVKEPCGVPSITTNPYDDYTDHKNGIVKSSDEFAKSWTRGNLILCL